MKIIQTIIATILAMYILIMDLPSIIDYPYTKIILIVIVIIFVIYRGVKHTIGFLVIFTIFASSYPCYKGYVRKSEASEIIYNFRQIIDAQKAYKRTYGEFYKEINMSKVIKILNIDSLNKKFDYNMRIGETTLLLRGNKKDEDNDYVYMFYPKENSDKIKGYFEKINGNIGYWENNFYMSFYSSYVSKKQIDIDLQNDGKVISTY
jgi:hypothetical protein